MSSVWLSLLWKEWREHRVKAALLLGACVFLPLTLLAAYGDWESYFGGVGGMVAYCVPVIAMFFGAAIAAGERSRGTVGFLQALPAPMWRSALVKLLLSCASVMTPAVITFMAIHAVWAMNLVSPYSPMFDQRNVFAGGALIFGLTAVSLLVWTAATGMNHVDELRAGAITLLAMAVVWAVIIFSAEYIAKPGSQFIQLFVAAAPGGVVGATDFLGERASSAHNLKVAMLGVAFLVSHAALAGWYVFRFGRRAKPQAAVVSEPTVVAAPGWLAPPRRSPRRATVWKQWRESIPLAVLGGLAILIISPACAYSTVLTSSRMTRIDFFETWQMTTVSVWLMAGVFVSLVSGIGLFYDDLRPGLHTFWRSRPIDVGPWFWTKLFVGLAITVGVLAVGPLVTLVLVEAFSNTEVFANHGEPSIQLVVGLGMLLHTAVYLLAALAHVLTRQPVTAALLTLGVGLTIVATSVHWMNELRVDQRMWMIPCAVAACGGLALLACRAVRRDWGWKS